MLGCKNLCRRHKRSLISIFYNFRQRQYGYRRFTASHIALHKTLHRNNPLHAVFYIAKYAFLPFRKCKRKFLHHFMH